MLEPSENDTGPSTDDPHGEVQQSQAIEESSTPTPSGEERSTLHRQQPPPMTAFPSTDNTDSWQPTGHRGQPGSMTILFDYDKEMRSTTREVLRGVLAKHPRASAVNLRELLLAHPQLGKVTLAELFDQRAASPRVDRAQKQSAVPRESWSDEFAKALAGKKRKKQTYDSMHQLVDRFYLAAVLEEHHTITAAARYLKITRVRLRSRLQALGLYGTFEN